jgi:hypothetical protein
MLRHAIRLGLPAGLALLASSATRCHAQAPSSPPAIVASGTPVCRCAAYVGPHYHLGAPAASAGLGANRGGDPTVSPNERGLPRGRRYYGGRYFGSFNNRYYGPQYGYF